MIRVEDSWIGGTWEKLVFRTVMGHQSTHRKEVKYEKIGGILAQVYILSNSI